MNTNMNTKRAHGLITGAGAALPFATFAKAFGLSMFLVSSALASCSPDSAQVGPICVDMYEASVWSESPDAEGNPQGIQFGVGGDDYPCSDNGNNCSKAGTKIFAVSTPGEIPSASITWFQAQQACANVGKRLLRNGEWQMAAAGTREFAGKLKFPTCNIETSARSPTGSKPNCVSNWGAFDMVGNVWEWVEDWIQSNTGDEGESSTTLYGNDSLVGIDDALHQGGGAGFPPALIRGGSAFPKLNAGVFTLSATVAPSVSDASFGFRCAK